MLRLDKKFLVKIMLDNDRLECGDVCQKYMIREVLVHESNNILSARYMCFSLTHIYDI